MESEYELFTTSKNISEFLVVLTKNKFFGLSVVDVLEILSDLLSYVSVVYPSEKSSQIFQNLLKKYNPKGLIIHDYEIIGIALSHDITKVLTMNIDDFKKVEEIELIELWIS